MLMECTKELVQNQMAWNYDVIHRYFHLIYVHNASQKKKKNIDRANKMRESLNNKYNKFKSLIRIQHPNFIIYYYINFINIWVFIETLQRSN